MDWKEKAFENKFEKSVTWSENLKDLQERFPVDFPKKDHNKEYNKMRDYIRGTERYKAERAKETKTPIETVARNKDGTEMHERIIKLLNGSRATDTEILEAHGINPDGWVIVSYSNTFWGSVENKQYRSKITVKPKAKEDVTPEDIAKIFERIQIKDKPKKQVERIASKTKDKLLVVNISDLHLGKLCWAGETGENYDYKIAQKRFFKAIEDVKRWVDWSQVETILFPIGNDFFNFDTVDGNTTKGTPQDNDLRWQKMFEIGSKMLIRAILELREIAPVHAFYVPGNHDMAISYYVTHGIGLYFQGVEDVTVSFNAHPRTYFEYGNTLLGFSHGDADAKRLPQLMPIEAREKWGRTKYHEFLVAHLHKEHIYTEEERGVIVRRTSSMSGQDAWHTQSGFVGAVRKTQHLLYDKRLGLTDIHNTVIE